MSSITYDSGTNTITVVGYTESSPCTFTDIYNADVAGSWGVVTKQCDNQFCSTAFIVIGDGTTVTWFADIKKDVRFTAYTADWQELIYIDSNAHFRIGALVDDTKKITKHGCSLSCNDVSYREMFIRPMDSSYCEIYDSKINGGSTSPPDYDNYFGDMHGMRAPSLLKIYNSVFENIALINFNTNATVYNIISENANLAIYAAFGDFDNLIIRGMAERVVAVKDNAGGTFKNIQSKGTPIRDIYTTNNDVTSYFVNCDFDRDWIIWWDHSPYPIFYRQYEFDLKVIDKDNNNIDGATVKIWDKDSTLVVDTTTDANGVIATQTISRGYYTQPTGNTLQEYSPHLIKVEKAGYTTYEADFTLDDKMDWLIALQTGGAGGGGLMRNPAMTGGMV